MRRDWASWGRESHSRRVVFQRRKQGGSARHFCQGDIAWPRGQSSAVSGPSLDSGHLTTWSLRTSKSWFCVLQNPGALACQISQFSPRGVAGSARSPIGLKRLVANATLLSGMEGRLNVLGRLRGEEKLPWGVKDQHVATPLRRPAIERAIFRGQTLTALSHCLNSHEYQRDQVTAQDLSPQGN